MSKNSQKRQRHATPAAQAREQRTNGRVVLLDEVVLNQLNGQRRLANTTSTHNNLRRPSVMRGGACAQGHDVQQRTNSKNSVISAFRNAKTKQRREADAARAFLPPALANHLHSTCAVEPHRSARAMIQPAVMHIRAARGSALPAPGGCSQKPKKLL